MVRLLARPETALFLVYWFGILLFLRSQPFNDPGALWHIRVGDLIFESGFPHTDPFTWSYHRSPWIPQQWLAECAMSIGHSIGGFDTLLLGLATLIAVFGAWVGVRFMRGGLHWTLALVLSGIGVTVAAFHFYIRPHMATFVLLGFLMGLLVDTERDGVKWNRWCWWIFICIIWTNLHGGVLAGLFTMALAIGGWTVFRLIRLKESLGLSLIWLACLGTIFINPFGLELLRTWWSIVGSTELPKYIVEHQPISLTKLDGFGILGFGLFYVVLLAGIYPRRPRITWLLPLVWFVLACMSVRHGPLFCAVAVVAMSDFFPSTLWFRLLKKHGDTLIGEPQPPPPQRWKGFVIPAGLVCLALFFQWRGVNAPFIGANWARLDPKSIPLELVEPLQKYAASRPKGYPIFNDANLGGFLIYFTPTLKIYFDDRCELYGDRGLAEYVEFVTEHPERIDELAREMHFELLLVASDTRLETYLLEHPESYREVARTFKNVLFERVNGGSR